MRSNGPTMRASAVAALLLTATSMPALAADEEPGLCRVMDIDEIAALTGQSYESPPFWDLADDCKYLSTSDPDGRHYVRLHLDGLYPYDTYREGALDPVDQEIGGQRAFLASDTDPRGWLNTQVLVDLGDVALRATIILDEGADPEQLDHTVRLAEMAVDALDYSPATPTEEPAPAVVGEALDLPEVEGLEWHGEFEGYGSELVEAGLNLPFVDELLEDLGADIAQLGVHGANPREEGATSDIGGYFALRVSGTSAEAFEPAIAAWLDALVGSDGVPVEATSLAGRDLLVVAVPDDQPVYVYVAGDTAHVMVAPEDIAVRILEALP